MPTMQETYEFVVQTAEEVFLRDGSHVPLLLIGLENEIVPVMMVMESREHKEAIYSMLEQKFGKDCLWYVSVVEGWSSPKLSAEELVGRPLPADDPERGEVLVVQGSSRAGEHLSKIWQILRDPLRLEEMEAGESPVSILDTVLLGQLGPMEFYHDEEGKLRRLADDLTQ